MENVKVHLKKITLKVTSEHVDGAGVVAGAKNSQYSAILRVEFVNWDGLTKYATFKNSKGENSVLVVFTLDTKVEENIYEVPIPPEAMTEEGMMIITFTGYEDNEGQLGSLANTATAYLRVLPSDAVFDDGSVTGNTAAQLQAEINQLQTEYEALPERVSEAAQYANNAHNSQIAAATSAQNAATSEANALAYKNRTEAIRNSINGGYVTCGSIYFADLPDLDDCGVGYMYSIKDAFETTSDFEEGAGVEYTAGTAVYKTNNNKWDTQVSDVATLQTEIDTLEEDKVDKVTGKQLSTEDFTTALLNKLNGIEAEATKTIIDSFPQEYSPNAVSSDSVRREIDYLSRLKSGIISAQNLKQKSKAIYTTYTDYRFLQEPVTGYDRFIGLLPIECSASFTWSTSSEGNYNYVDIRVATAGVHTLIVKGLFVAYS